MKLINPLQSMVIALLLMAASAEDEEPQGELIEEPQEDNTKREVEPVACLWEKVVYEDPDEGTYFDPYLKQIVVARVSLYPSSTP